MKTSRLLTAFLMILSVTPSAWSASTCSDLLERAPGLNTRFDWEETVYPEAMVSFLRANPAYTKAFVHEFESMEQAYILGRVRWDWDIYRKEIPSSSRSILDIGSGIGGLDMVLYHALEKPSLTLVDKAVREQEGKRYNVIETAKEFLTANGVDKSKVKVLDASDGKLMEQLGQQSYDTIISLRGLAYMFPYSVYRDVIKTSLQPGGVLIVDITTRYDKEQSKDAVITERFEKDGSPTSKDVMKTLEEDLGKPKIIGRGYDFIRVKVVRTK